MNNNNTATWTLQVDHVERWAFFENLFSKEECEKIISICSQYGLTEAKLISGETLSDYRNSKVVFVQPNPDTDWIYRKLTDCILYMNDKHFKFDLFSFGESLQFTQYNAPSGKYDYHIDKVFNAPIRKLSIVLQLTDENAYEGGDFETLDGKDPQKLPRQQGTLLLFPSYTLHRVTEVTKGTRHSLVGWINGKPFK